MESAVKQNRALVVVSAAVFLASSTWFTGTAVMAQLRGLWGLTESQGAWLTASTQLGFVAGTLLYSLLNIADVCNPRRVFLISALLGAGFNAAFAWVSGGLYEAIGMRFLTGVTLAGVYPVGMKIIATWFQTGLGWRLGVMVGALTLGTAAPYLTRALGTEVEWRVLVTLASGAAAVGGILMAIGIGDGPFRRERAPFDVRMLYRVFENRNYRNTAFAYFGHMWELYAFWALVSMFLGASLTESSPGTVAYLAFAAVGAGAVGCVGGGWLSRTLGERRVAIFSLAGSAICCVASGFASSFSIWVLAPFVVVWGILVVADSAQFSALAARHCPPEYTATALTVQNGVGFAITIGSIQLLPWMVHAIDWINWRWAFAALAIGPVLGAWFIRQVPDATDAEQA